MAAAAFRLTALALACAGCTSIQFKPRSFEGVSWHVSAIDGQDTPPVDNYRMEFANGRVSAQFGCNHFGGTYRVERNQLVVSQLAGTRMGCPEPAGTLENRGTAILREPMQITANSGGMMLSNRSGQINLVLSVTGRRR
jgi:heat shock protein HslJ